MMREQTVFGPIFSRRLGRSLGINLLPTEGKLCNFDCIYCECGWNRDGRDDKRIPSAAEVRSALEDKLAECLLNGTEIDSITFSGDGEPTLNPDFPLIVEDTLLLRDAFCPSAKVSVLSNATRLGVPEVVAALKKVDNPILKIDAPTRELAALVNQPCGEYDPVQVVRDLEQFGGDFILQTMFLKAPGFDSSSPEVLQPWMEMVRHLHPREIMVYTIDRPTPAAGLEKFTVEQMQGFVQPLIDEGYKIQIKG